WAASARRALDFVRAELWRDGRLLATHKDGRSHLNAYLDDYAFLLAAVLETMQAGSLRADDLHFACALADVLLAQFEDPRDGGFFFTSHDHEALVLRPKSGHDGATASGNGVAVLQLQRLGHLVGEARYLQAAERALSLFAPEIGRVPHAFPTLVSALAEWRAPPAIVALTGASDALGPWRAALARAYRPRLVSVSLPGAPTGPPPALARPAGSPPQDRACRGPQCLPPIATMENIARATRRACGRPSPGRRAAGLRRGCAAGRNAGRRSPRWRTSPRRCDDGGAVAAAPRDGCEAGGEPTWHSEAQACLPPRCRD